MKKPPVIAFEMKLETRPDWPEGFQEYVREVTRIERFRILEEPQMITVYLHLHEKDCFQGWLELAYSTVPTTF